MLDEDVKFGFVKENIRYLNEHRGIWGGDQYLFRFDNNYGASVIKNEFSYGGSKGYWELMVIKWVGNNGWEMIEGVGAERIEAEWKVKRMENKILGDSVIGFLSDFEVAQILSSIKNDLKGVSEEEDCE